MIRRRKTIYFLACPARGQWNLLDGWPRKESCWVRYRRKHWFRSDTRYQYWYQTHNPIIRIGSDWVISDRIGSDWVISDRIGSDRIGSGRIGSDRIGSDRIGSDCLNPGADDDMRGGNIKTWKYCWSWYCRGVRVDLNEECFSASFSIFPKFRYFRIERNKNIEISEKYWKPPKKTGLVKIDPKHLFFFLLL